MVFIHLPYFLMLIIKIELIPHSSERNLESVLIWLIVTLKIYRHAEGKINNSDTEARISKEMDFLNETPRTQKVYKLETKL